MGFPRERNVERESGPGWSSEGRKAREFRERGKSP